MGCARSSLWRCVGLMSIGAARNVIIFRRKQRTANGRRPNIHPLAVDEIKALKRLFAEYGAESDFVFATERRGIDGKFRGFTMAGFAILLRRLEAKAGIANFGPHALRHGWAQRLAERGQDACLIRDALGPANVSTSNAYVAASPGRLRGIQPRRARGQGFLRASPRKSPFQKGAERLVALGRSSPPIR